MAVLTETSSAARTENGREFAYGRGFRTSDSRNIYAALLCASAFGSHTPGWIIDASFVCVVFGAHIKEGAQTEVNRLKMTLLKIV